MLELLAAVGVVVKQSTATTATQDPRAPPATAGGSATPATASIPEAVGRSRGQLCATPLLTLSSSGNTRGQETQSSWAQNKRNSETIQRREPKPGLVNIHLIPPSRKSRESGAPESWWFHNETELKRLGHPSPTLWMTEGKKNQGSASRRSSSIPATLPHSTYAAQKFKDSNGQRHYPSE